MRAITLGLGFALMLLSPCIARAQSVLGVWQKDQATITISMVEKNYLVTISCPGCMMPIGGTFMGPYKDNMILIQAPMGIVTYNGSRDTISYGGLDWTRRR